MTNHIYTLRQLALEMCQRLAATPRFGVYQYISVAIWYVLWSQLPGPGNIVSFAVAAEIGVSLGSQDEGQQCATPVAYELPGYQYTANTMP